jgi:hypothetical protein
VLSRLWWGHGTVGTWQVAPKREERGGQRKATQQRSWLVLSLVYDKASELSRRWGQRLADNEFYRPKPVIAATHLLGAPTAGHPQGVSLPRLDRRTCGWGAGQVYTVWKTLPMSLGKIHYRRCAAINDSVGKFPIPTRFERECHSHLSLGNPFPNRVINRRLRPGRGSLSICMIGPWVSDSFVNMHYYLSVSR